MTSLLITICRRVPRFVIVSTAVWIVLAALNSGSAFAQTPVPPGSSSMYVWEPDSSPSWVNGQPQGYAEGETAAMTVEVTNDTTTSQSLNVCIQVVETSGKYGFVAFEPWDTTVAPTVVPNGNGVSISDTFGVFAGQNMTISSVTAGALGEGECDPEYLGVSVIFNKVVGNDDAYFFYGGRLSQQGEVLPAGLPDQTVPAGKSSSFITGTFQSRITGGDETVNFKGDYIEPDGCPDDPDKNEPGICGCGLSDADNDGDGIADCNDQCPNDALKSAPGQCGCGVADTDSDGDGTADCNDLCVNDSGKTSPGICGCGLSDADNDGDGIADCNDQCPNDALKSAPGQCGCGVSDIDSDGDGTADCNDLCLNDSGKTSPGICGCGVSDADNDGDGVADCNDQCPNDPIKTAPGQCGCGVADTDSDGDGTADCNDLCAEDSSKTSPGICGCGVSDADNDGDGVADCNDQCPNDVLKSAPGQCGCGVTDTDSDGDGTADCNDLCAEDESKTTPGICGCGVSDADNDGDGLADCDDQCPNDALKSVPGQCGCGVADTDSDGDGTADCNDLCVNDSEKTSPGICGCGNSEVDSDGDGTLDCQDECPSDPSKIVAGECGCFIPDTDINENEIADCQEDCNDNQLPDICDVNPEILPDLCRYYCYEDESVSDFSGSAPIVTPFGVPLNQLYGEGGFASCGTASDCNENLTPDSCEADSDQDGTIDSCDNCPADPNKLNPGICGCGVADTDSDQDGTADCNDQCPADPLKTAPGTCGCGLADVDSNENGVIDCTEPPGEQCFGLCTEQSPDFDEDGDSVSNCTEIEDGTDPCDRGSFKERLAPTACAGPNGFFQQTNILTIINRQSNKSLEAFVVYRDFHGVVQGTVTVVLGKEQKRDIIVNDLGLAPDTYGTVCVFTDAEINGAWSGGLTLYKERFDLNGAPIQGLTKDSIFDYALYYPLTNPLKGESTVPLNTNSLGTGKIPSTQVANWVRITDAKPGDGKGISGKIRYYNQAGKEVGVDAVGLPDGGRFDFSGHDQLGQDEVGLAEFIPAKASTEYYIESSRYVYEGVFFFSGNFWTAYVIPNRPATGVPVIGRISTAPNELAIVELVNASNKNVNADFQAFNASGTTIMDEALFIPAKASRHVIVTGGLLQAGFNGSAEVSGPSESISAMTLVYRFGPSNDLLLALAPSFLEALDPVLRTEFNSFIGHTNTLELINGLDQDINATGRVLNFNSTLLGQLDLLIPARGTLRVPITVPENTYGTIIVDSGNNTGLVIRNDVSRASEYVLSFPGF